MYYTVLEGQERLKLASSLLRIIGKGRHWNLEFCIDSRIELMPPIRFWGIFWIDASSYATAQQGFLEIARVCKVEEDVKVVKGWLSDIQEHWLLIIDNADDPSADISAFFPTGNRGSIVITTRNPDCKIHSTAGSYELGEMDLEDAVTLFLRAAGMKDAPIETLRKKAITVVQTLGCLALAIVQAGAYVRNRRCTVDEYCAIYARHRERLLTYRPVQAGSSYKFSVYTTWEISFEAIKKFSGQTADNAIELIRIFCFLHYDGITEEIFEKAWKNSCDREYLSRNIAGLFYINSQEPMAEWDPFAIREAAALLASFSLIRIDASGRRMSMHPLVHVWVRDRLPGDLQKLYRDMASYTLATAMSWTGRLPDIEFRRALVNHIDSCINLWKDGSFLGRDFDYDRIEMAARFAYVFSENGRLRDAMELGEKVLEARHRTLGSDHLDTLRAMDGLAKSYGNMGRWQEAMELFEKVWEVSRRTLGSEHPNTLMAMYGLANSCGNMGRMQEAMELWEKVLEASRRTLGSEHPGTLGAMHGLAKSYSDMGRMQEAMELIEKVWEVSQRTLGSEHPDTLRAMHDLANKYRDVGRQQEAVELMEKVLEAMQRTLGIEHPDTLRSMNNLANSYSDVGYQQEAMELWEKVLEVRQRTLGSEHPDTLRAMHALANSYGDMGGSRRAEGGGGASQGTLSSEYPNTQGTMNNPAVIKTKKQPYRPLGKKILPFVAMWRLFFRKIRPESDK